MEHLVFRLYGPLGSWGDIAPGTHRPSLQMPTRSAILGLIGAALGLSRSADAEHNRLSQGLGIAARRETRGAVTVDYHTAQSPRAERGAGWNTRRDELSRASVVNTILSSREYNQDSAYTIAVWQRGQDGLSLPAIQVALENPRYPLFLGRRSCPPALPLFPKLVAGATLKEVFERAAFPDLDRQAIAFLRAAETSTEGLRVEFDPHPQPGYTEVWEHPQRDDPAWRSRWQFRDRSVYTAIHPGGRE